MCLHTKSVVIQGTGTARHPHLSGHIKQLLKQVLGDALPEALQVCAPTTATPNHMDEYQE